MPFTKWLLEHMYRSSMVHMSSVVLHVCIPGLKTFPNEPHRQACLWTWSSFANSASQFYIAGNSSRADICMYEE